MDTGVIPGASAVVQDDATQSINPRLLAMFMKKTAVIGTESVSKHSLTPDKPLSKTDQQYSFTLPQTANGYVDLQNTQMYIKGNLTKSDGSVIENSDKVIMSANICQTLFESCTVLLGNSQLELYCSNYHYKSYIRQLVRFKNKSPIQFTNGFNFSFLDRDTESAFEAGVFRFNWTGLSKTVEFQSFIAHDLFTTPGFLLPATPLKITFRRSPPSFYTITLPAQIASDFIFNIEDIRLITPVININSSLVPLLESQTDIHPSCYSFSNLSMKMYSLPAKCLTRTFRRIFENKLPSKLLLGFFNESSYVGTKDEAPFMTADVDLSDVKLAINGVVVSNYKIDFKKGMYMDVYRRYLEFVNATK